MEKHVDNTAYLNPPDDTPEYSACDGCGEMWHTQDLTKTGKRFPYAWLCDRCLEQSAPAEATE